VLGRSANRIVLRVGVCFIVIYQYLIYVDVLEFPTLTLNFIGIFTNDGADWSHSREMLRPNFVRSQIGDVATFEKHVSHLISKLPTDGTTVNLSDFFFRLTMDSATEFLFGESTDSLTNDSEEGFAGAFNRSQDTIAMRSRFGPWVKRLPSLFGVANMEKDQKFVHDFVDYYVEKGCAKRDQLRAEKQSEKTSDRYIFIDELVSQTDDRTRIRSECLNILLAGRDTTASLLTNVWWILSKRPDLWAKLQTEVASLDGVHPTFEQLKDLKFLRSFLNETLRLYPVVPQNSREAQEDTTLPVGGGPDGTSPLFVSTLCTAAPTTTVLTLRSSGLSVGSTIPLAAQRVFALVGSTCLSTVAPGSVSVSSLL
jgi:cytochrome P450